MLSAMIVFPAIVAALAATDASRVTVDWDTPIKTVHTAATIEVDVMPHLGRTKEGGDFDGYYQTLQNLKAGFVRFAPWFGYPKVVVAELFPPECSPTGRGSSWNASLISAVLADFMAAVCGVRAADGECDGGRSVVPQLSTMPEWMYEPDGRNRTAELPADPWQFPSDKFDYYLVKGRPLRDPSCREMARYAARWVGWFTAGGMVDECGVRHSSGLRYNWPLLSVLNEDECDSWRRTVGAHQLASNQGSA